MSETRLHDYVWRSWDRFFKLTNSFRARLFSVSLLTALALLTAYLLQRTNLSQIRAFTVIVAVLMALCGGPWLGFLFTVIVSIAIDYFFIPPLGEVFVTTDAQRDYFLATLTAVLVGLLVSSLRTAFQKSESAVHSAEAAVRARDEMVAIISHELKNPLTVLQTGTALIQRLIPKSAISEQVLKIVERMPPSIQRMNVLVSDLLDITRLEANALKMHPLDCSLLEIVQEVVGAFASAARKRSVDLRIVEFPPDTIRAFCDSTRAAQILENLVENAIKFTNPGGSVCVSASRKGNDIEVAVTDTGIGISPEHLPRIFDRFWQAKESAYKGIGLGLAISKALTEAQGGTISVRSIEGQGTSVLFTLPSGSFAPRKLKAS